MASNGNCFICGKTAGKTAIKNHIFKEHDNGTEECYLIKAEGAYDKDYWLLFSVPLSATLLAVDDFLRDIWCECCGHLSAFLVGRSEISKSRKLETLYIGDVLMYEYDFGTTTHITVTVVEVIFRAKQKAKVCLLARNVPPPEEECVKCGAAAEWFDAYEYEVLCDKCADEMGDEGFILPIVNSPRCGACGYEGENDIWTFDPKKPFPQPNKAKSKGKGLRTREEEISAEDKWNTIDIEFQNKILSSVFCRKCHTTTIIDYIIENAYPDIVLRGKCEKCGNNVARLVDFN